MITRLVQSGAPGSHRGSRSSQSVLLRILRRFTPAGDTRDRTWPRSEGVLRIRSIAAHCVTTGVACVTARSSAHRCWGSTLRTSDKFFAVRALVQIQEQRTSFRWSDSVSTEKTCFPEPWILRRTTTSSRIRSSSARIPTCWRSASARQRQGKSARAPSAKEQDLLARAKSCIQDPNRVAQHRDSRHLQKWSTWHRCTVTLRKEQSGTWIRRAQREKFRTLTCSSPMDANEQGAQQPSTRQMQTRLLRLVTTVRPWTQGTSYKVIGSESKPIREWVEARAEAPRVKAQWRSARNPHAHTSGGRIRFLRYLRASLRVSIFMLLQLSSCVVWFLCTCFASQPSVVGAGRLVIDRRWFSVSG